MSSCTGLSAVDHANTRFSRGYSVTGVRLALCARHEVVTKNGVGDLQKGEKFGNMTYIFASMLRHICMLLAVMLSYDINCMGRTDREGVERPWANIGPVATSMREMGPGHRHDMLDDHWHDWNWRKIVALGKLLAQQREEAIDERQVQEEAFSEFSCNQLEDVPAWRERVECWEADSSQPNPYKQMGSTITLQEVRWRLAEQESVLAGAGMPAVHEISPAEFMILALEVEEQQRKLKQEVAIIKSNGKLVGKDGLPLPAPVAEDVRVLFPSDMTLEQRSRGIWPGLDEIEIQLRDAQYGDALDQLRNQLIIKACLLTYKAWEVKSVLINGNTANIGWRKLEVRDIKCMHNLDETAKERKKWEKREGKQKQKQNDGGNETVEGAAEAAGLVSWESEGLIDAEAMKDGLRVEWSKCWAQVRRWREEEMLLSEEMRRVLVSLEWRAQWWLAHGAVDSFSGQCA
ncbi:hypothetical protein C8J56DRAFT_899392 [Mycena floridula]|nr:hypothetical protein C8J56DRAFT_899392 [Mycena floridula]